MQVAKHHNGVGNGPCHYQPSVGFARTALQGPLYLADIEPSDTGVDEGHMLFAGINDECVLSEVC